MKVNEKLITPKNDFTDKKLEYVDNSFDVRKDLEGEGGYDRVFSFWVRRSCHK